MLPGFRNISRIIYNHRPAFGQLPRSGRHLDEIVGIRFRTFLVSIHQPVGNTYHRLNIGQRQRRFQIRIMSAPDILDVPFLHELFHTATRLMESGDGRHRHTLQPYFTRAERITRITVSVCLVQEYHRAGRMPGHPCVHPSRTLVLLPYRGILLDNPPHAGAPAPYRPDASILYRNT